MDPKPHLITVEIEWGKVSLQAQCPYDSMGSDRPCALLDDNPDPVPAPPPEGPPTYRGGVPMRHQGDTLVPVEPSTDPWILYEHELEIRPAHVQTDACWVEHWLAQAEYDLEDVLGRTPLVLGPVPMDWTNTGGYDDSSLELTPWTDDPGSSAV